MPIKEQPEAKKYFYLDNWTGKRRSFNRLRDAKGAARLEDGLSIAIYQGRRTVCIISTESQYVHP